MKVYRQAASVVLLLGALTSAARVVVDWNVGYVNLDRDGHSPRRAIGVNGALPIPPVFATRGDTLVINVHNSLDVTTSIHAHGLFQNGTSFMDGPAMVTQCGIPPGHSFTYEYEADHAGTFWLHGHDHHQNSDGLRAPLVVHERREPHRYDEEYLLSLEDWYPFEFAARLKDTLDPTKTFPPPASFPYALFNGHPTTPTLKFKPGKTYRFRILNMSTTEWFQFNLPGHQMRVIEADGEYSQPSAVDGLDMGPGERYSVLVTAHPTDSHNYHYNATLYAGFVPRIEDKNPRHYQGLIEYREGAPIMPTAEPANFKWVSDVELCSLSGNPPLPVDRQIELTVGGSLFTTGQTMDVINNITYAQPLIPSLYSAMSLDTPLAMNKAVYGPQTHAIILKHLEYIELLVNSPNSLPHPMHLHGHAFQIIEYGSLANKSEPVRRFSSEVNAPMQRDTIVIPVNSYVKIRFRADNPGVWLFHCHMDIHFGMGMALTFIEAPDVLRQRQKVPEAMLDLCRAHGIRTEGNGAGNTGLDLTGLPLPPMYLHGHAFQIIELGSLVNNSEPVVQYSSKCNSPMKRDIIVVPNGHYIKIRLRADNPGVWLLHCHMDIHFGMGMALTFIEASDVLCQRQKVPDSMLELCRAQGIRTKGKGAGNTGLDLAGLSPPPTTAFQNGRPSTPTPTPTNQ